jgi:hypothetical protein
MDITSANATLLLGVSVIYPSSQPIYGFAADDIFDTAAIKVGEFVMGADGRQSGGFVYASVAFNLALMADSPSNDIFDTWIATERARVVKLRADMTITLPSIGRKYVFTNGGLESVQMISNAKKTLEARKFTLMWESVSGAPI